eukprot:jgi/Chrpa1/26185/Chrysochromulina_OHIO_Genome00008868-RA
MAADPGITTVSHRVSTATVDPDLAALRRLPQVAPLLRPQTAVSSLFGSAPSSATPSAMNSLFGSASSSVLPELNARNVSLLCREFAALSRHAALPICEEQRAITKKMSGVEALCTRVLYLIALRSSEFSTSAATLRELRAVRDGARTLGDDIREATRRVEALEARLMQLTPGGRSFATADDVRNLLVSAVSLADKLEERDRH